MSDILDISLLCLCLGYAGLISGHKVVGVRMVLEDGVSHPVDSSEIAFKLAAIGALRQCMSIIICTPPECTTCMVKVVMHMSPKKKKNIYYTLYECRDILFHITVGNFGEVHVFHFMKLKIIMRYTLCIPIICILNAFNLPNINNNILDLEPDSPKLIYTRQSFSQ